MREYVDIVRAIWAREKPLEHHGEHYEIPTRAPGSTGLGKPLKSILHGRQIPIYIAATAPRSVEQTAAIADGWLPIFFSPFRAPQVYREALQRGFAKAGNGKSLDTFDIAASPTVLIGDDIPTFTNFIKPFLALYIGGMGARGKNFYNDLACRYGFEAAAKKIQDLYLDGKKDEAATHVPDELVDEVALIGPKERIRDRLSAWKEAGVKTLICSIPPVNAVETVRTLAEIGG
jgi:F420-dependent oxidoreductase-like protein